jgi:hypothetical protein
MYVYIHYQQLKQQVHKNIIEPVSMIDNKLYFFSVLKYMMVAIPVSHRIMLCTIDK